MRERKGGAGEEEEEVRQLFGQRGHNGHRVREREIWGEEKYKNEYCERRDRTPLLTVRCIF